MKKSLFYSLAVMGLMAATIGAGTALFFYKTEAQTKQVQTDHGNPVAWKRIELPVKTVDSNFRVDLPPFSADGDYIIGVKPVKDGEKEKMYAGLITWERSNEKIPGFLKVTKMENYPAESESFTDGKVIFSNTLTTDQTLVVYLEVSSLTKLSIDQIGNELVSDKSEKSFIVYKGKKEPVVIDNPATLLNELHIRKLAEGVIENGGKVTINKQEEK